MQLLEHKWRYLTLFLGTVLLLTAGYLVGVVATGNWPGDNGAQPVTQSQADNDASDSSNSSNSSDSSDSSDKKSDQGQNDAEKDSTEDHQETNGADDEKLASLKASLNQQQLKTVTPNATASNDFYDVRVSELSFDNESVVVSYQVTGSDKLGNEAITINPKELAIDYNRVSPAEISLSSDQSFELVKGQTVTVASKSKWATGFTVSYLFISFPRALGNDQEPLAQPLLIRAEVSASE
ncbi:hypothetical protein ACTQ5R_06190 [Ruoffia tabacinasalis]|uniref:hypothetical protein n=1 Tax=Ruoffia tabacinasalis TaxID=87458 RepID=UPI003F9C28DA